MDRLAKIKHAHSLRGPENNGLVSEDERWMLAEVERLRKIEDEARAWGEAYECKEASDEDKRCSRLNLSMCLIGNPRPSGEGDV